MNGSWDVWIQHIQEWSTACHSNQLNNRPDRVNISIARKRYIHSLKTWLEILVKAESLSLLPQSPLKHAKFSTEVIWMKSLALITSIYFWKKSLASIVNKQCSCWLQQRQDFTLDISVLTELQAPSTAMKISLKLKLMKLVAFLCWCFFHDGKTPAGLAS